MRFKVKKFLYPCGANDERKEMNLIIDEHFADAEINRHLVLAQMDKGKPISTPIYYLCIYLNYLDEHGLEAVDVKMSDIQDFLQEIYIDGLPYAGKGKPCSYAVIQDYIEALSKLYDNLTLRGYKMDESLYTRSQMMMLAPTKTRKKAHVLGRNEHLTMVHYLTYMFSPNQNDVPKSAYVKWYSAEQINAIADALPLVYRCIFLDTVYVGHRVGGALSLTLDSVDLYNGTVTPTKSKTGKIHTSYIPAPLIEDMRQYLIEVRRNIATDSNAFFIGRNGKSVTYQAYHVPVFHQYSFLADGICESIYYKLLIQQHDYALSMQEQLKPQYQGYLFVHPNLLRIITTNDFNSYLVKLCADNNVVDSDGNAAKITSHDLRHINVCERLQGNVISATETMVECNHSSMDQTLGYGYPSKKDEAKHLAKITKQIPLFGEQKEVQCLQVPSFKYDRLLDEPTTRMIPGYGICCNQTCKPQFEKCLACESFLPDPAYRDYFSAAIELLLKRNQRIVQKHGDNTIVQHNEELIRLYQVCIKTIDSESTHRS